MYCIVDNMNATLKQCGDAILQRCVNAQMQQMQHCNQNAILPVTDLNVEQLLYLSGLRLLSKYRKCSTQHQ